jgi:quinol monooxygenase YgiN
MPVVVAVITPKSGKLAEVEQLLAGVSAAVHQEPGCELYCIHKNTDTLVIVEKWADADALAAHRNSPTMANFGRTVVELVEARAAYVVDPVSAGDPSKGTL